MRNILIYGLQRSGSNFLEKLLLKNFKINILNKHAERNHPLHKHFRLYDDKKFIPEPQYYNEIIFSRFSEYENALNINKKVHGILIISKDPFSWYISYKNWAKKCNWSKPDYDYIEEYIKFYKKWIIFSREEPRIIFTRYIDLLIETNKELNIIKKKIGLKQKPVILLLGKSLKVKKVNQSDSFNKERYKYYLNKEYMKELNKKEFELIKSKCDQDLLNNLKYNIKTI